MSYCYSKTTQKPFSDAEEALRKALKAGGFGIITEIDAQKTMKEKLGIDTAQYRILGACNPELAHRAISAEPDIGVLLPCNVLVRQDDGAVVISAILPAVQMGKVGNPALQLTAAEVEQLLKAAVDVAVMQKSEIKREF